MTKVRICLLFLVVPSYSFPLVEDNRLEYDPVRADPLSLYDEETWKKAGENVASWKSDSDVNPEELGLYMEGDIMESNSRNGLVAETARWPGGVVPYEIGGSFSSKDLSMIQSAMAEYHKMTCIRFVPRQRKHQDYLLIMNEHSGCWSSVGRIGGPQKLNLQTPGCTTTLGTPVHEMMHAVGFLHEQNRYERDKHVVIHWENIQQGRENNFEKAKKGQAEGQGVAYDYRSVMHYSAGAFSKNGQPTIVPRTNGVEIGQRKGFSRGDVQKIRHMYKCGGSGSGIGGTIANSLSSLWPFGDVEE